MAKTMVLYGDSGTFKTTALCHAAKYLWKKHKKPIRLITAEESQPLLPYVNAGMIQIYHLDDQVENPLAKFKKLSMGEWESSNPSGIVENCSAYFIEGLTSISELLMRDLREKQRRISQDPIGSFTEDGEKFCQAALSHYGFVQNTMIDRILCFAALPVDRVIFTAHEGRGEEESSRSAIRGAALVGTKGTDRIPKFIGSYIHAEHYHERITMKSGKEDIVTFKPKVRYFFMAHPDAKFENVTYPAKPRVPHSKVEELMKMFPGGYFEPTLMDGLDKYLAAEDALMANAEADIIKFMETA